MFDNYSPLDPLIQVFPLMSKLASALWFYLSDITIMSDTFMGFLSPNLHSFLLQVLKLSLIKAHSYHSNTSFPGCSIGH